MRLGADEGDLALVADGGVEPEAGVGRDVAEVKLGCSACERLDPHAGGSAVVGGGDDGFVVGHPESAEEVAIDAVGQVAAIALEAVNDEDILVVAIDAVAGIDVGDVRSVRRRNRLAGVFSVSGDGFGFAGGDVEHLRRGVAAIARVSVFDANVPELIAVGREGDGRGGRPGREGHGQSPRARGGTFGFAAGGRNEP